MSKLLSMREAIARFVADGSSVLMGAALESLIPFAAGTRSSATAGAT